MAAGALIAAAGLGVQADEPAAGVEAAFVHVSPQLPAPEAGAGAASRQ